jgi:hypothetical protein
MNRNKEDNWRLNESQVKRAVKALTRAFWNHPPLQYYYPDEAEREGIAPYFFSLAIFNGRNFKN